MPLKDLGFLLSGNPINPIKTEVQFKAEAEILQQNNSLLISGLPTSAKSARRHRWRQRVGCVWDDSAGRQCITWTDNNKNQLY